MESDQYMPDYWPANRIIGKLEKALVKAENILGLIQSEQIANLAAGKVTGLLTNAQLESIEAAKLTGLITGVQVKEETLEARHIKAASIVASKLAAGSVTAEKLSVATLSAISANLGTVTAGIISAVKIDLEETKALEKGAQNIIDWLKAGKVTEQIYGISDATEKLHSLALVGTNFENVTERAMLFIRGGLPASERGVSVTVGEAGEVTIFDGEKRSSFLQLAPTGTVALRKIAFGTAVVNFPGGIVFSEELKVNHGLGAVAKVVVASAESPAFLEYCITRNYTVTQFTLFAVSTSGIPPAGTKDTIHWTAIG